MDALWIFFILFSMAATIVSVHNQKVVIDRQQKPPEFWFECDINVKTGEVLNKKISLIKPKEQPEQVGWVN